MPNGLTRVLRLTLEGPRLGKLAYCLLRDGRVPSAPKAALAGGLGLIISPIDIPAWIPVVGDLDMIALSVLALRLFVDACPEEIVDEHRKAIRAHTSVFDSDLRAAVATVREASAPVWAALRKRVEERRGHPPPRIVEDETA